MSPLDYPDRHHLNAAAGWLELGALAEAQRELARISGSNLFQAEVLDFRWHLLTAQHAWAEALEVARLHVRTEPKSAEAWIHQSFTLHELKRTDEAYAELHRVAERFSDVGTIPYNLACYTCRLGRLEEARTWLKRACKLQGKKATISMAAEDPDLASMRDELRQL